MAKVQRKTPIGNFQYRRKKLFILSGWRNIRPKYIHYVAVGDCNDYALTAAIIASGGWFKFLLNNLFFRSTFWLVKSSDNKFIPRHTALWQAGKGWTDSTYTAWRSEPIHSRIVPIPFFIVWLRIFQGIIR